MTKSNWAKKLLIQEKPFGNLKFEVGWYQKKCKKFIWSQQRQSFIILSALLYIYFRQRGLPLQQDIARKPRNNISGCMFVGSSGSSSSIVQSLLSADDPSFPRKQGYLRAVKERLRSFPHKLWSPPAWRNTLAIKTKFQPTRQIQIVHIRADEVRLCYSAGVIVHKNGPPSRSRAVICNCRHTHLWLLHDFFMLPDSDN